MLFLTCTKLTFGLSDVLVVTVIARNRINGVGSLFFRDRILRFGENMTQRLKRFLNNFIVVAIQNSLDGFNNTLNVRNNSKTGCWFPYIRSATCCTWFLAVTENVQPFAFRTLDTYFLSSAFESSEDGRESALLSKVLATGFLWQIGW